MTGKEELLNLLKENKNEMNQLLSELKVISNRLYDENEDEMNQLQSELRTISYRLYDVIQDYKSTETGVKRVLNTEEHGNCHLNCKYYRKDSDTCYYYLVSVVSRLDKCIADVLKEYENRGDFEDIKKENEKLKNALKNSYLNEICENCKYGHYFRSYNFEGFEGDFECKKGHDGVDCDGLKDCDDFELEY